MGPGGFRAQGFRGLLNGSIRDDWAFSLFLFLGGWGFRKDLAAWILGLEFGALGVGFRLRDWGFGVWGSGFRV